MVTRNLPTNSYQNSWKNFTKISDKIYALEFSSIFFAQKLMPFAIEFSRKLVSFSCEGYLPPTPCCCCWIEKKKLKADSDILFSLMTMYVCSNKGIMAICIKLEEKAIIALVTKIMVSDWSKALNAFQWLSSSDPAPPQF